MAAKIKSGASKSSNKRTTKPSSLNPGSKSKRLTSSTKSSTPKPKPTQHKPGSRNTTALTKTRKPPHLRYTAEQLKIPHLNGIKPDGVRKLPNQKKGKVFVDDGDGMRAIMALVMAEKEGDVESKMMRARQMEEVREARRVEMEKRKEGRKADLEGRKEEIRKGGRKRRVEGAASEDAEVSQQERLPKKAKKKVSFG